MNFSFSTEISWYFYRIFIIAAIPKNNHFMAIIWKLYLIRSGISSVDSPNKYYIINTPIPQAAAVLFIRSSLFIIIHGFTRYFNNIPIWGGINRGELKKTFEIHLMERKRPAFLHGKGLYGFFQRRAF